MNKDFEEYKEKIRPYYGQANFTDNMQLFKFIKELEEKEVKE